MPVPFHLPRLYPIVDTGALRSRDLNPVDVVDALLASGVSIVQLRHKDDWIEDTFQLARQIAGLCEAAGAAFVLNDRVDYASLLRAAVHLGQDDLPPLAARRILPDRPIGLSTHNREQILRGDGEPIDYIALGPIYETNSKLKPDPAVGLKGLKELRALTGKPLVAIGGISLARAPEVMAAGADSVAVIGGLLPAIGGIPALRLLAGEWLRALS